MGKKNLNAIVGAVRYAQTGLTASTPANNTTLFNITGPVRILEIAGVVKTTAMEGQETLLKLTVTVDALAETDICDVLDCTGDVAGTKYNITGTFGDDLVASTVGVTIAQAGYVAISPVTSAILDLDNTSAANDGQTFWSVVYQAMAPNAFMVPAV